MYNKKLDRFIGTILLISLIVMFILVVVNIVNYDVIGIYSNILNFTYVLGLVLFFNKKIIAGAVISMLAIVGIIFVLISFEKNYFLMPELLKIAFALYMVYYSCNYIYKRHLKIKKTKGR